MPRIRTPLSNHSVEANCRPAAPLEAGRQFGSRFYARPDLPAAVAHLGRSTMEMTPTRSNVRPRGLLGDSARLSASSTRRPPAGTPSVPHVRQTLHRPSGCRGFRAIHGEAGHIPSNHSVHRTAAGHSRSGVGFAADVHASSRGGR